MQNENIIILIGQVGSTPEFKNHDGTKVAKYPLATSYKWKDKDGNVQEKTTWHNIVAFGFRAEYARDYISKGAQCYVNGRQENFAFEKEDGTKIYGSQVVVSHHSADRYQKKDKSEQNPPNDMPDFNIPENIEE